MSESTPLDIRTAAMDLLARREHLRGELEHKLLKRFQQRDIILQVLDSLAGENLQSDDRFIESYIRQRAARGFGPLRIRQELIGKGAAESSVSQALASGELDSLSLARGVLLKKFGNVECSDIRERFRRMRFLQYRGFDSEIINAAME